MSTTPMRDKLTRRQIETMDAMVQHGNPVDACVSIGMALGTLQKNLMDIRVRLGMTGHDVRLWVMWDRESRGVR